MATPHKHCDLIVAWANGAEIQHLDDGMWTDCFKNAPRWYEERQYRIKPEPLTGWVNIYQNTAMSAIYETKELADKEQSTKIRRVDCIKIQWSIEVDPLEFMDTLHLNDLDSDEFDDELEDE